MFLEEKLKLINTLDKEQLKAYYTKVLEEGTLSKKGGAGLGLIEMAKKSQKPIQMEFKKLESDIFAFNMQIDLIIDGQANADLLENPMPIEENTAMYDLMVDNNMIFLYKGDFSDETISPMLNILEGNTGYQSDSTGYKIYHAAVELILYYKEAHEWLSYYITEVKTSITVTLDLSYFNSSSAKQLLKLLMAIDEAGIGEKVIWIYPENNDILLERGQELEIMLDLTFEYRPK